jgi:hypothetical protein
VEQGRRAQWRPCRIKAEPLKDAADWVEQYRALWEERFDRLDGYLKELKQRAEEDEAGGPQ